MSLTHALIAEMKQEASSTKKMLAQIPTDKMNWTPHPKSMEMKKLATHIAGLASWPGIVAKTSELDLATMSPAPEINTATDLVQYLEQNVQSSIEALFQASDESLNENWVLKKGDHIILEMPRKVAIRSMSLNHLYHHRAQLGVYLRLLDVPIPGMYGPSADDLAH